MAIGNATSDVNLILAAEDCALDQFPALHKFSNNDKRVIEKLIAHGPVLLEGGRGSGKSALMIAASLSLAPHNPESTVFGIYLSLRHLPLLRPSGREYEEIFCKLVSNKIQELLSDSDPPIAFQLAHDVESLQYAVAKLSREMGKRVVLLFDDAAHIGREASLGDFFDIFRTLSSNTVSCKATIYPGVTNFGTRFDIYNDATVVEVIRDEDQADFSKLFFDVLSARYPALVKRTLSPPLSLEIVAGFLGQSVLGNMRGFVFACNELADLSANKSIGLSTLGDILLKLAVNYYWPLLEEVSPKLGKYVPMVEPARQIAEAVLKECGTRNKGTRAALVHREIVGRLSKPFEILEYAGFISMRESSRALKSGGRGSRYALNLCILLENVPGTRLTNLLFDKWRLTREEPVEFHVRGSHLTQITLPELLEGADLGILSESVEKLKKSNAYPYGLTSHMIDTLVAAGKQLVGDLTKASDEELDKLESIGPAKIKRIRSVVAQAIWM